MIRVLCLSFLMMSALSLMATTLARAEGVAALMPENIGAFFEMFAQAQIKGADPENLRMLMERHIRDGAKFSDTIVRVPHTPGDKPEHDVRARDQVIEDAVGFLKAGGVEQKEISVVEASISQDGKSAKVKARSVSTDTFPKEGVLIKAVFDQLCQTEIELSVEGVIQITVMVCTSVFKTSEVPARP